MKAMVTETAMAEAAAATLAAVVHPDRLPMETDASSSIN